MSQLKANFLLRTYDFLLDVQFECSGTGITALFGESGSGKTSLLRCIAGLEPTAIGQLTLDDVIWQTDHVFIPVHERGIATVFQDSHLFPHLSIIDNLRYGQKRNRSRSTLISEEEAITMLGIEPLLNKSCQALSGGQRQRVALARALLSNPRLILMDEPLASLDVVSKQEILPYLETIQKSIHVPIIYVSHALDEVLQLADAMLLIDNGKILANGDINTLLTRTDLPLATHEEACSIISGMVKQHDHHYQLSEVSIETGTVLISALDKPIGEMIKLRILARDVSIALSDSVNTSITNVFPVKIINITEGNTPSTVLLKLTLGTEYLLAQITAKSSDKLGLEKKMLSKETVFAQLKSVALS